jgi:hypothetical protein
MIFCNVLMMDIQNAQKEIQSHYYSIYKNSFSKKYDNIILAFNHAHLSDPSSVSFNIYKLLHSNQLPKPKHYRKRLISHI